MRVKALVAECRAELDREGVAAGEFDLGVMMETPAAALIAGDLARHVAFFSIGTNDLTQYVMAADRLNPRVADLNRADHPAVLRAVELICAAAREAGIWVGRLRRGGGPARPHRDLSALRRGRAVDEPRLDPPRQGRRDGGGLIPEPVRVVLRVAPRRPAIAARLVPPTPLRYGPAAP